jgi:alkyl hydroperoxide reductase subunit AhpC
MAEKTIIKLGKIVKNFTLQDQFSLDFVLSKMRGWRVVLSFHPLAWTPVCTLQMQSLEKNKKTFDNLHTIAVGLSVDSVPCKAAWAKAIKIKQKPRAVPGTERFFTTGKRRPRSGGESLFSEGLSHQRAAGYR